jgi:hypothetical protein
MVLLTPFHVIRAQHELEPHPWKGDCDPRQTVRLRLWQWTKQDGIHNAEHRGSRTHAKRQRQNRNEPESGILAENSGSIAQVHPECPHGQLD